MDGLWYDLVRNKLGEQTAAEWSSEIWLKRGAAEIDVARVLQALNISEGKDVATLLKMFQCDPGTAGCIDIECELKNENLGILTCKRCRPLETFERHGEADAFKQKHACEVTCVQGMQKTGECVNPRMKSRPLKLPPRKNKDEIACQWEFKLEE